MTMPMWCGGAADACAASTMPIGGGLASARSATAACLAMPPPISPSCTRWSATRTRPGGPGRTNSIASAALKGDLAKPDARPMPRSPEANHQAHMPSSMSSAPWSAPAIPRCRNGRIGRRSWMARAGRPEWAGAGGAATISGCGPISRSPPPCASACAMCHRAPSSWAVPKANVDAAADETRSPRDLEPWLLDGYEDECTQASWMAVMTAQSEPRTSAPNIRSSASPGAKRRPSPGPAWATACACRPRRNGEYACRAGSEQSFSTSQPGEAGLDKVAWFDDNTGSQPCDVKLRFPNPVGLYDMLGNVWEWTEDCYGPYSTVPITDPPRPCGGAPCCARGGSWGDKAEVVRAANRLGVRPDTHSVYLGFRMACSDAAIGGDKHLTKRIEPGHGRWRPVDPRAVGAATLAAASSAAPGCTCAPAAATHPQPVASPTASPLPPSAPQPAPAPAPAPAPGAPGKAPPRARCCRTCGR